MSHTMPVIQNTPVIEELMVNKWDSRTNRRDASGRAFCWHNL